MKLNRKRPANTATYADALARKKRHKRNARKLVEQERQRVYIRSLLSKPWRQ